MDCGPTCLRMIANYYGKQYSLDKLRMRSGYSREGVSLLGLSDAAESIGMRTAGVKVTLEELLADVPLPCIIHWEQSHFVVVTPNSNYRKNRIEVADPIHGMVTYTREEFSSHWLSLQHEGEEKGIALLLEPSASFGEEPEDKPTGKQGLSGMFKHLFRFKKLILQLFMSFLFGSCILLIFPFLTQSIIDIGIATNNIDFIYLILFAQLTLFLSKTLVEFIRSWILMHISTRINLSILSDFLIKLMKLPVSFFDTKMYGDILQRIQDHRRIESFLTQSSLSMIFSGLNLVIFSIVLGYYSLKIFLIFCVFSILYFGWVTFFLKRRKTLDYKRFGVAAKENSAMLQIIQGMQEVKLNNSERPIRWNWESLQAKLFKFSFKGLALNQYQQAGAFFLNETKNIIIIFLCAKAVVDGNITLGTMLSIQYILGQLNSPIEQFIQFVQAAQDARISLERLNEIHSMEDEESPASALNMYLPSDRTLRLADVTFCYPGQQNQPVLNGIDLEIPQGKITAIVGASGSGKTTLLKLLLKFYQPQEGALLVGETNMQFISHKVWRSKVGTVLQDGFIFSDSIARNIAVGEEEPEIDRLLYAARTANILEFIESLPMGFNTKIGAEGNGISQGQRQRILIARAVYKNPEFIFFDEATNSLDANNERAIISKLKDFFKGKTVVIVAHRLSTVVDADQIVVLQKGKIIERGTHDELVENRNAYYHLVRNQLELGR